MHQIKLTSGRIQKVVAQIFDGEDRGATEDEVEFITKYYNRVMRDYPECRDDTHYRNIYSYVCFILRKEDYFL